jgi:hypothetical protein
MDAMQELVEINALKRLKARYFFFLDTKDWDGWIGQFTEDATLLVDTAPYTFGRDPETEPIVSGRQTIYDFVSTRLATAVTVHHGHTPLFEFQSDSEASGIWTMEDIVETERRQLHGHGHYHETYRKVDGRWRFATVHLRRLRLVTSFR